MFAKSALPVMLSGVCVVVLSACGSSQPESATKTVVQTITAAAPSPEPATVEEAAAPAPKPKPKKVTKAAAAPSSSSSDCITVPNVVGKDHQLAQDTMQAAGLYNLDEEDATGQGRMLLFDRNWTTVAQDPAAGQCVPEDTTVMLSAKKDGE
jgi:hypothetical protein